MGKVVQKSVYTLNQHLIYGAEFPIATIHRSRDQGVEMGVVPLTITNSDPLEIFLLPVPMILCSSDLEVLVPKRGMLPPGDTTMIPLNWKLRQPPNHFVFFMPLNQQAKQDVMVLACLIPTTPQWR